VISQEELAKYKELERKLKTKAKKLQLAKDGFTDLIAELQGRVAKGERIEKGLLTALIDISEGRANISWKDELIKVKGNAYATKILMDAVRPPVEKLVVKEA